MTEKLKPCPFCGGEAHLYAHKKKPNFHFVYCYSCDGVFSVAKEDEASPYPTDNEIIELWNSRYGE